MKGEGEIFAGNGGHVGFAIEEVSVGRIHPKTQGGGGNAGARVSEEMPLVVREGCDRFVVLNRERAAIEGGGLGEAGEVGEQFEEIITRDDVAGNGPIDLIRVARVTDPELVIDEVPIEIIPDPVEPEGDTADSSRVVDLIADAKNIVGPVRAGRCLRELQDRIARIAHRHCRCSLPGSEAFPRHGVCGRCGVGGAKLESVDTRFVQGNLGLELRGIAMKDEIHHNLRPWLVVLAVAGCDIDDEVAFRVDPFGEGGIGGADRPGFRGDGARQKDRIGFVAGSIGNVIHIVGNPRPGAVGVARMGGGRRG